MLKGIRMNYKKIFYCLIFFIFSNYGFSLSFGIKNETILIKNKENEFLPDFFFENITNVFISESFICNNFFFVVNPMLVLKDDIAFKFDELKMTVAFEKTIFSVGKYNSYWGSGFYYNPFFCNLPINNAYEENLWNGKISYTYKNWEFNLGVFIDSNSIDNFQKPIWQNYYFFSQYSNQDFLVGIESDYLNSHNEKLIKFSTEFLVTKFVGFSIYTSCNITYDFIKKGWPSLNLLLGFSHYLNFDKNSIIYMVDFGVKENKHIFTSAKFGYSFFEICNFETQIDYFNNEVYILTGISFDISTAALSLQYVSPNLINYKERDDKITISVVLGGSI